MIPTESTDEAIQQEQKEQRRRKEVTDKLMVDDTDDEFLDSENESIHDIISDAFTIADDLLH